MRVERYRLDNGLGVLLLADASAPVVSYQTWLAVGSRFEPPGKTGLSHMLEHMMFIATEQMAPGDYDRRLEEAGAEGNAATFFDWTHYVVDAPRAALPLVVALEADRLQNVVLSEEHIESEREVIINERRETVEDDVEGAIVERLYRDAFQRHGYGHPTIGWMADIEALSADDCRAFYETYYAPNNATVVVVGDVDPQTTLALIERHYGAMASVVIPAETPRPEPPQDEERRATLALPTEVGRLAVGYRVPAMGDPDHAPLVLLNEILFGGRSGRVHRALVEDGELASEVYGSVGTFRDPALWDLFVAARDEVSLDEVETALDALLGAVRRQGVTPEELARARARTELQALQVLESAAGRAERIGFCEVVLDDPSGVWGLLDAYARVTEADVLRVARRYLVHTARTIVAAPAGEGP